MTSAARRSGELELDIVFLDNGNVEYDAGWGARRFTYSNENGTARFSTRFVGERNVRQVLADLANSRTVGFLYKGEAVMSADLAGAGPSIAQLQECAARAVASR